MLQRMKHWISRALSPAATDAPHADAISGAVQRAKASWEGLGKHDPLWAIVSVPDKQGNRWDVGEFFANGALEVQHALNALKAAGIALPEGRALDFGCGVGRLTQALALRFAEVDGVDISAPMIEQARGYSRHGERVRYHQSAAERLPFPDATFDFVFSKIVLQHVALDLQKAYVREFFRVVRPGGLVLFQAMSRTISIEGTHFESPVETPEGTFTIDMNTFPRHEVEQAIAAAGGRVLHVFSDGGGGDVFESLFYAAAR
jgi:ubiquinone/menaquinone biosynthesis C-methylase UbiE